MTLINNSTLLPFQALTTTRHLYKGSFEFQEDPLTKTPGSSAQPRRDPSCEGVTTGEAETLLTLFIPLSADLGSITRDIIPG